MALSQKDKQDIAEMIAAAFGIAAPAESAPAEPVVASPTGAYVRDERKSDGIDPAWSDEMQDAYRAAEDSHRLQAVKLAAAVHAVPRFSCDAVGVDSINGSKVGHGFYKQRESGAACDGARGIARGESCKGHIN